MRNGHVSDMRDLPGHSRPSCKAFLACRHGLQRVQVLPRVTACLAPEHSRPFRIRRACLEDADSIARINAEVCTPLVGHDCSHAEQKFDICPDQWCAVTPLQVFSSQLPVEELDSPLLKSIVNFTEARLHATIRRESRVQVQQALTQKRQVRPAAQVLWPLVAGHSSTWALLGE